mmetsp:Transcript_14859/g.32943  ORF Transcript_14859/g.32943 Transcript_14859/m.32943 type:complete len:421 (-) Transcript_14859:148-1410(-)
MELSSGTWISGFLIFNSRTMMKCPLKYAVYCILWTAILITLFEAKPVKSINISSGINHEDDPGFRYRGKKRHGCSWVQKNTIKRCGLKVSKHIRIANMCRKSCASSYGPPKKLSTHSAFRKVLLENCVDMGESVNVEAEGLSQNLCDWAAANRLNRCDKTCPCKEKRNVMELCQRTCQTCDMRKYARTTNKSVSDECQDSPDCLTVAEEDLLLPLCDYVKGDRDVRCEEIHFGQRAAEICPKSCRTCIVPEICEDDPDCLTVGIGDELVPLCEYTSLEPESRCGKMYTKTYDDGSEKTGQIQDFCPATCNNCEPPIQPTAPNLFKPSTQPRTQPPIQPTTQNSFKPSTQSRTKPSTQPSTDVFAAQDLFQPSTQPRSQPSIQPTAQNSLKPSTQSRTKPSTQPSTDFEFPPSFYNFSYQT